MIEHPRYPIEGWHIRETQFDPAGVGVSETLFATANGYLGLRGNLEEADPVVERGTYLNGFYETRPYVYPESAYGFAREGQTMLNVTDGKILRLTVDGDPLDVRTGTLVEHNRVLDLRRGFAGRELVWESPGGARISVRTRRLVSFTHKHLACIEYEVTALSGEVEVVLDSELVANESDERSSDDPREVSSFWGKVLEPVWSHHDGTRQALGHRAARSGLAVFCAADHTIDAPGEVTVTRESLGDSGLRTRLATTLPGGSNLRIFKHLVYDWGPAEGAEAGARVLGLLDDAVGRPMEGLLAEQTQYLDGFWRSCHLEVDGDDAVQQATRFALFQVLQASACLEGTGIPAKGLTGQGYGGHYFWDMETYVLQALTYLAPERAAAAIKYRHATLRFARDRARELSKPGAMYPWRTIDGHEASAFFPAGTAEYHISADVAESVQHYVELSDDLDFLAEHGAEILVETARLWMDLGFFNEDKGGAFCINEVTGPDEYTAMVNNNAFTNLMAQANLANAAAAVERLAADRPDAHASLTAALGFDDDEVASWRRAAEAMYLHWDEARGLHGQDDTFLDKEPWPTPVSEIPAEQRPLLLHYHPLDLYRRQVIKQADLVMAMFLQGQAFTPEQKRANFDYYDAITTGDSSLSRCIQAIIAAEVGHLDLAWTYTRETAVTDLENLQNNVHDGIHIASQAGTWLALVCGFGGLRRLDGTLHLDPKLPAALNGLTFRLQYHGTRLEVVITSTGTTYTVQEGDAIEVAHCGRPVTIAPGSPVTMAARPT